MTAAAAPATEQGAALARDTITLLGHFAGMLDGVTEWADDALAGGEPPKWVAGKLITAGRLIAAAARGEEATR